ncbi:MAG TPA: GNAT family N-acetyltransferase [Salinisphaeraceae bacterium]|nr:GNAT family N-acetyltransferase [Salinisphaeraceae bacterium]
MYDVRRIDRITALGASAWNALLASRHPFLQHGFLAALEASASAAPEHGWQPAHLLLYDEQETLAAAAPLYSKSHSFGEFVFDFAWANAYRQLGLNYYPKLLNAVPFTPVVGPRLLARDAPARAALARQLAALADGRKHSSLHSLFAGAEDRQALAQAGASLRRDCHYRWYNRGYRDFNDFLAALTAKRRKNIRRERRRMHEAGVHVEVRSPHELTTALQKTLYAFYARTYAVRGQTPYLTPAFFAELHSRMPDQVLYFIAMHHAQPVGMAFMLVDDTTLYGRHWGCAEDYHSLHFETCYYAGIEYCIRHGLCCFDAGAQGEHKLHRGFEPVATWSAHVMAEPQLAAAVADFNSREAALMADYQAQQSTHTSFSATQGAAPAPRTP